MNTIGKTLMTSAITGMVLGSLAIGCGAENAASGAAKDPAGAAKACCKGQNECKSKGSCKTDKNECKGKNECKNKGGCNSHCPKT